MTKVDTYDVRLKAKIKQYYKSGSRGLVKLAMIVFSILNSVMFIGSTVLEYFGYAIGLVATLQILVFPPLVRSSSLFSNEKIKLCINDLKKLSADEGKYYSSNVTLQVTKKYRLCKTLAIICICAIPLTYIIFIFTPEYNSLHNGNIFKTTGIMSLIVMEVELSVFLFKYFKEAKKGLEELICKKCGCFLCFEQQDYKEGFREYTIPAKWDSEEVVVGHVSIGKTTATVREKQYYQVSPEKKGYTHYESWTDVCCNCHIKKNVERQNYNNNK